MISAILTDYHSEGTEHELRSGRGEKDGSIPPAVLPDEGDEVPLSACMMIPENCMGSLSKASLYGFHCL